MGVITGENIICANPDCNNIVWKTRRLLNSGKNLFCNQSCAAKYNNKLRPVYEPCPVCTIPININVKKCCSHKCTTEKVYREYITSWKTGLIDGNVGMGEVSAHIRKYLFEKYDNKCSKCGWDRKHPTTGLIPLQIEHIDGNWRNNKEENLDLLCPNCHSLTLTFGALNKGQGRRTNGGWYK